MTTTNNYRVMTDAELIDEALEFEVGSVTHELAVRASRLQIQDGYIDDSDYFAQFLPCFDCENTERRLDQATIEFNELLTAVLDNDQELISQILKMNGE